MPSPLILWLDFATKDSECGIPAGLSNCYRVKHCEDVGAFPQIVEELAPNVLCFNFDYPGPLELALLQKTKRLHPSVPILMLTQNHSTELVIWALRARVWDCFLKPVSARDITRRLNIMLPMLDGRNGQRPRKVLLPDRSAAEPASGMSTPPQDKTREVLPYLREHFNERVVLSDVAKLCRMGVCEFSRTFRREQGMTFRDYLTRLRVEAAAGILRDTSRSVLDIACSVGVNDPSQFSRLFRRHMGVTPSDYRHGDETIRTGFNATPENRFSH